MTAKTGRPRGRPKKDGTSEKPKRNYNPASRANLRQYSAPKAQKEQAKQMQEITDGFELDISAEDLEVIIPTKKLFIGDERERFMRLFKLHIKELTKSGEVTFPDLQLVSELCKNIIMEDRLLTHAQENAKKDPKALTDVNTTVNNYKKRNKDISESLATNRNVRIDFRQSGKVTILDVIEDYERKSAAELQRKLEMLKREEDDKVDPNKYRTTVADMIKGVTGDEEDIDA
jgi:acetolactate synthase small subunit